MTHEEIISAHKTGKVFAGTMREDATDCDVIAFDTEEEAKAYCLSRFDDEDDIRVVGVEWTDMEVLDPAGYYSGSHGRYSMIPMMYPDVEVA